MQITDILASGMRESGTSLRMMATMSHYSKSGLARRLDSGNIPADDAWRLARCLGLDTRMRIASLVCELAPRVLDGPRVDQHHMVALVRTDEELIEAAEAIGRLRRLASDPDPDQDDLDRMGDDALQVRQAIDAMAHLLRTLHKRFGLDLGEIDARHAADMKAKGYIK